MILFTEYFSTKSKNKSVEKGCEVRTRVHPHAELINAKTPENQYNELKHSPVNGRSKIPEEYTKVRSACDMQINLGNPVVPDEQEITAACEVPSATFIQLK